jgi:predicted small secreted protein
MSKKLLLLVLISASLAACGTYTPGAHRHVDASTGSMLSDQDTGINPADNSMRAPTVTTGGYVNGGAGGF